LRVDKFDTERSISASEDTTLRRQRTWTRIWGVAGALFLLVLMSRLPGHLQAAEPGVLLRDGGLALLCTNMIVQAVKSGWPVKYSMSLSFLGVALWLAGVVLA
jgi:hypothetical protein